MITAGDWNARAVEWSDAPSARGDCLKNSSRFRIHASLQRSFCSTRGNTSNINLVIMVGRAEIIGFPELLAAKNPGNLGRSPIFSRRFNGKPQVLRLTCVSGHPDYSTGILVNRQLITMKNTSLILHTTASFHNISYLL